MQDVEEARLAVSDLGMCPETTQHRFPIHRVETVGVMKRKSKVKGYGKHKGQNAGS